MSLRGPTRRVSCSPPVSRRRSGVLSASVSPPFPVEPTFSLTPRPAPYDRPASTQVFRVFPSRPPVFEPTRTSRCVERVLLLVGKATQVVFSKFFCQCGRSRNLRHTTYFVPRTFLLRAPNAPGPALACRLVLIELRAPAPPRVIPGFAAPMDVMRIVIVLALVIACLTGAGTTAVSAQARACISTPEDYRQAWDAGTAACVSPGLMGTVHTRGASRPYPMGFWKAWAVNHSGLENFLALNAREGSRHGRVGLGVLSMVGFPGLTTWDEDVDLAVYALPAGAEVNVPTFATWFRLFEDRWPARSKFRERAQRNLIRSYSTLGSDPVAAFESVTGCSRERLLAGASVSRDIGCNESFMGTIDALGPSPYGRGTTRGCLRRFADRNDGARDASALRAVLFQCEDAGFLFSGVGWTYNTYANPMICGTATEQGIRQRYTEPEFVIDNVRFADMESVVHIPLTLASQSDRRFLQEGYC